MPRIMLFRKNHETKIIILILTLSIISAGGLVLYFGGLNHKQFEKTIVAYTHEHMLGTIKAEAAYIEDELNDLQLELELLALNPTVRERIKTNVKMSEIPEGE